MRLVQVDAFADVPFAGNPAAVCLLDEPRDDGWMQHVASEMNLAETAFLLREGDAFSLRWFTPAVEVDLCGHATLASAHALWEEQLLQPDEPARFTTKSGLLTATRSGRWIELDFPSTPAEKRTQPDGLAEALGADVKWFGQSRFDMLVELEDEDAVRNLRPDFAALRALGGRGVIVTAAATHPRYQFVSRFFGPAVGIDEDPVTGSAHCSLAPFWTERLGRLSLTGFQCSPRGGIVRVRLDGDRVKLGGQAVTVLRGDLLV